MYEAFALEEEELNEEGAPEVTTDNEEEEDFEGDFEGDDEIPEGTDLLGGEEEEEEI